MNEFKTCSTCGNPKILEEFVRRVQAHNGRASICRDCFRKKIKDGYTTSRRVEAKEQRKPDEQFVADSPRCTCTSRKIKGFIAHDAGCMIFAHNRLDGVRRSSALDEQAMIYGG